jgi:iron(III) transport system substrate-binding protein
MLAASLTAAALLAAACSSSKDNTVSGGGATTAAPTVSTATQPSTSSSPSTSGSAPANVGTFGPVFDAVKGLTGSDREQRLVQLAKDEGNKMTLYTAGSKPLMDSLVAAFQKQYGIKVDSYRADQLNITQRITEESKAGRIGADVVYSVGNQMVVLSDAGMFVPYSPPDTDGLTPGSVRSDGWIADQELVYVVAWNKNAVKSGDEPKTYEDLADDKWNGQIAIDVKDADWYYTLYNYWVKDQGKTPEEADALFKKIFTGATATNGTTATDALVAAGQYKIFATDYWHTVNASIAKGAPMAYLPAVEPVFAGPQGMALLKDAANPAAAVLFADWLVSKDGQQAMLDSGSVPVLQSLIPDEYKKLKVVHIDVRDFQENYDSWQAKYSQLLQLASKSK